MKKNLASTTTGSELFDPFFDSGFEESVSPFLHPEARKWGVRLKFKATLVAAFLLFVSFVFSFSANNMLLSLSQLSVLFSFFFAGIPPLISAVKDLVRLSINIEVLMTLAAFLSILLGDGKEGALLLVLFSFSGSLEGIVNSKAKEALSSLKKLSPQKAFLIEEDGSLIEKSIKDIPIGSRIHIKAGQIIPLDGVVEEGISSVSLIHLTGENLPHTKKGGDSIPAGARNLEGSLTMTVTSACSNSTLAQIIQLITEAHETKPKFQRWLTRISSGYAMTIIILTFIFALGLPLVLPLGYSGPQGSIYRALAFLIAASPCALILAMPIAYLSAISSCAKKGIVLKGGAIFDALAKCKAIAFDKTGTLTQGELTCVGFETFGENPSALPLAYTLECSSMHPIAHAIVGYAQSMGVKRIGVEHFEEVPGYGVKGFYQNRAIFMGHISWITPHIPQAFLDPLERALHKAQESGEIVSLLYDQVSLTLFRFKDQLRPKIRETLKELKKENLNLMMLTGDHEANARSLAKQVGIETYYSELRPEDKLQLIAQHTDLAMVGDGMNDAPALARASVGISMGRVGETSAIDASDVVLLNDHIEGLTWLFKKSYAVRHVVRQNISIALVAILFATTTALLGWIPLWLAVILHEGGTVLVGLNALRLLRK